MTTPIEEFKRILTHTERAKGINSATAKIIAEIFASTGEISIEELAKKTKYSLATISNSIRFVEQYGAVTKLKKPGSKKIYVKAERDFMKVLAANMNKTHEIAIRPLKQTLPNLIREQKKLITQEKKTPKKEQLKAELKIIQGHLIQVQLAEEFIEHIITACAKNRQRI